jgi:hypothetical protein
MRGASRAFELTGDEIELVLLAEPSSGLRSGSWAFTVGRGATSRACALLGISQADQPDAGSAVSPRAADL